MNVNSCPAYFEQMGAIGESNSFKFTTLGLTEISFIIQAFDDNGNAVNFANQKYSIWCSNDDLEYIKLFDVNLGFEATVTNSLKEGFQAAL